MKVSGRKLLLAIAIVGAATIATVVLGFRSVGWTRFQANSRLMEGKSNVVWFARAVIACAEETGKVPETSKAVPATLADVGGKTWKSTAADWSADETLRCARWSRAEPQAFRYQWEKTGELSGRTRAEADFDGDGVAEAVYEQEIDCQSQSGKLWCRPGPFHDIARK